MKQPWRLNAKWAVAVLFVVCTVAATIAYSLYRVSAEEPATGTSASVIDALAEEMVDDQMFADLQAAAKANPEAEVQVNQLVLPLTGEEMAGLTREETLEKASARLADIIYVEGVEAGEDYFRDPQPQEEGGSAPDQPPTDSEGDGLPLGALTLFTQETHDGLRPFAVALLVGAAALLAILLLLSRGFGRLGSPGLALIIGVGPAALALTVLRAVFADARDGEEGMFQGAAEAIYPTVDDVSRLFTIIAAVAAVVVVASVIGHVAYSLRRGSRPPTPEPNEEVPPTGEPEERAEQDAEEGATISSGDEIPSIGPGSVPQA